MMTRMTVCLARMKIEYPVASPGEERGIVA